MNYSQKLRDPRWQKRRLQILERDGWSCQSCRSSTKNLQVHHLYYAKLNPWDYPDECYQTLCEDCHEERQKISDPIIEEIRVSIGDLPTKHLKSVLGSGRDLIQHGVDYHTGRITTPPLLSRVADWGPKKVYLAGKVGHTDWRHSIVPNLRNEGPIGVCMEGPDGEFPDVVSGAIFNRHHYVGPFFVACDHGCFHGPNSHGQVSGLHEGGAADITTQVQIRERAVKGIRDCDLFFAYLETEDCFGTLFEIGYATAIGKRMAIVTKGEMRNLWFSLVTTPRAEIFNLELMEGCTPKSILAHILGVEIKA